MQNRVIAGALPITAKLLGQDLGLVIHFGAAGFAAEIDDNGNKHLHIPDLPMDDDVAERLALGGILHEDAHFSFTTFLSWEDQVLQKLVNILEDVRCEALQCRRYPGAAGMLKRMIEAMVQQGQFNPVQEHEGLAGIPWYILYRLRASVLGQEALGPLADGAAQVIKPLMPGASFQRLTALMYDITECRTTGECADLAVQILAMLKEEAENPTPPEQQNQVQPQATEQAMPSDSPSDGAGQLQAGSADAPNQDGSGASAGDSGSSGAATGADGADTQGEASAGTAGDGTETAPGVGASSCSEAAVNAGNADDAAKRAAMKEFLAGAGGADQSTDVGQLVAQALNSVSSKQSDPVHLPEAIDLERSLGEGEDILMRLRGETNAVRRKIQNLLEAKSRATLVHCRASNRMDPKRLWRVRTGDTRVFEKRIEGMKQDTAIVVLLDRSTSMRNRIGLAADAALSFALAMDNVPGVDTSVVAFPESSGTSNVLLVSDFSEPCRKVAARFPAVGVAGTTPMAEALLWSGYHLHATRRGRKIVMVVTDGNPNDRESTEQVLRQLHGSGIEVMGLGIDIDVSRLFSRSGYIADIADLPQALFGMLQEALAKAA